MTTNAPQIPVKIITALWFSILAPGISPNQSQNKNYKKIRKGLQRPVDSHWLSCFIAMIIPQNEREIMMMTARTQPDPAGRSA